jgi:hypothetical protein
VVSTVTVRFVRRLMGSSDGLDTFVETGAGFAVVGTGSVWVCKVGVNDTR